MLGKKYEKTETHYILNNMMYTYIAIGKLCRMIVMLVNI